MGALRLAALDARGIALIDPSAVAAWRSLILLVPVLLIQGVVDLMAPPANVDAQSNLLLSGVATLVQMTGYLLAVSKVLEGTGRGARFPLFMSTYTACSVISSVVYALAIALALQASDAVAGGIAFGLMCWGLFYSWFSARAALDCPGITAVGLVLLEVLIAILVQGTALQLVMAASK